MQTQIDDTIRQRFIKTYKEDRIYNKIIQDLYPLSIGKNEEFLDGSKFGYTFYLADGLFYSKDNDDIERLIIPFPLVQEFL